jgi:probable HAF family extracellular repeat protein
MPVTFTIFYDPSATNGTQAFGINDMGQIVGTYNTSSGTHAFLYSGGVFTTIDDPVNGHTFAYGINNNGHVAGTLSDGIGNHGFLRVSGPNAPPPAGTTADMILRGSNMSPTVAGQYEIYDIGNNAILAGYSLGQVGPEWTFVTLGGFNGSDTTDMLLRNSMTGGFEVYDISNNNITAAAFLGTVGLDWQVAGFGNFSSLGENDMMLRNKTTGGFALRHQQ